MHSLRELKEIEEFSKSSKKQIRKKFYQLVEDNDFFRVEQVLLKKICKVDSASLLIAINHLQVSMTSLLLKTSETKLQQEDYVTTLARYSWYIPYRVVCSI